MDLTRIFFLDPGTRTYVEKTGGANFLFVTKDNEVVTPLSDSILPSITRRSLVYIAEHYLGLKVTTRKVRLDELKDLQNVVFAVLQLLSPLSARLLTMVRRSVSQAVWRRWDLLPRSYMIH